MHEASIKRTCGLFLVRRKILILRECKDKMRRLTWAKLVNEWTINVLEFLVSEAFQYFVSTCARYYYWEMKVELLSNGDLEKKGKSPLGWLRLKGVPFSCFRYKYERLGISVVEAGERAGNLSFWSLKGPKFGWQIHFMAGLVTLHSQQLKGMQYSKYRLYRYVPLWRAWFSSSLV